MSDRHLSPDTEIPELHILPLGQLVEHEHADAQRTAPLIEQLQAEDTLQNPPIIAALSETPPRFVVLDGSNRIAALRSLGYPHVLVQQVHYAAPHVRLKTWRHVVTQINVGQFTNDLKTIRGLDLGPASPTETVEAFETVKTTLRHNLLARLICADGQVLTARATGEALNLHRLNHLLNRLVETYQAQGQLFRATTVDLDEVRRLYPELTALVIFPTFQAAEVLALVHAGELLPPGLTRHLIEGRALRLNYPLSELRSADALETKETRLQAWLSHKLISKEIRYYKEATYLFDE
jgi:hypothetical protein